MNPATAEVSLPATAQSPRPRARAARWYERIIESGLAGCGLVSIAIIIGIVVILARESADFFAHVSLAEFLGSTHWTPIIGEPKSYGVWPLLSATFTTAAIAMVVAVPLGLLAAIYLSEYAGQRTRRIVKPALELLAGVPTIVFGYFAITVLTPSLKGWIPDLAGGNLLSAGIMMGVMIVPLVASLSEDALYAVPSSLREAAAGLGGGPFEVIRRVVVPSAWSGIAAAITLAASRAVGETMIVAIAAGNEARFGFDPREPGQTATAFIVDISKGETPHGSVAYQTIFAVAAMLFVMTLIMNVISHRLSRRLRASARA
ncbi:MAG: phosphate ABC transporter permease subunit PstC [Kofleriaceae bacterium]|nr:phosphate ABC transporter permease subunit PstC [Kofleriaceae bacterium]MBP9169593.1 phosphate ABC transporter permease subunit PstC [Kofleriaceae bacterium]MBP9858596.1 phosphate ABC transporter permease subunit PstC [Kofleriaceae bacterium]